MVCINLNFFFLKLQLMDKAQQVTEGTKLSGHARVVHDFATLMEGNMLAINENSWHQFTKDCLDLVYSYKSPKPPMQPPPPVYQPQPQPPFQWGQPPQQVYHPSQTQITWSQGQPWPSTTHPAWPVPPPVPPQQAPVAPVPPQQTPVVSPAGSRPSTPGLQPAPLPTTTAPAPSEPASPMSLPPPPAQWMSSGYPRVPFTPGSSDASPELPDLHTPDRPQS